MSAQDDSESLIRDWPSWWQPRRLAAVAVDLPEGVTPPGTRGRILRAALGLYSGYGFHGTSIRQIASQVGINPATLYAHYPSKEQILAELVLVGHQELHDRLRRALAGGRRDPAARLAALVREHAMIHADYPLLARGREHRTARAVRRHAAAALDLRARCRGFLADVLDDGARSGEFHLVDPSPDGHRDRRTRHAGGALVRARIAATRREQVADTYVQLALRMVGAITSRSGGRDGMDTPSRPTTSTCRAGRCGRVLRRRATRPVLAVHGITANAMCWQAVARALPD